MTIVSRQSVRKAYDRAMALDPNPIDARQAVAQSLCLTIEAVEEALQEPELVDGAPQEAL